MSGPGKRKKKEETVTDQSKPFGAQKKPDDPAVSKDRADAPPAGVGEPKEKQNDAPATSENEQIKVRGAKTAREEAKNVARATDQEGHLQGHLQEVQARADKPDAPPVVKLTVPPRDEMGGPANYPPHAPAPSSPVPAPRFCHENERSPQGLVRFKIRVTNFGSQDTRYVLAHDEAAAKAYYLKGMAIDRIVETMGEEAPKPMFSCVRLVD